jgi:hypothetical protein
VKKWKLTVKVLIEQPIDGETKTEAFVFGVNALKNTLEKALPQAKVVITLAKADEEK